MLEYEDQLYLDLWTYNPASEEEEGGAISFLLPLSWAKKEIKDHFNMSVEDFLKWYTYDHSILLYNKAVEDLKIKHVEVLP